QHKSNHTHQDPQRLTVLVAHPFHTPRVAEAERRRFIATFRVLRCESLVSCPLKDWVQICQRLLLTQPRLQAPNRKQEPPFSPIQRELLPRRHAPGLDLLADLERYPHIG